MNRAVVSLIWEVCARERWATIFAVGALPVCCVINLFCGGTVRPNLFFPLEFIVLLLALATIFWLFCFAQRDAVRGSVGGFSAFTFVLPIRTAQLVSVRVAGGMVAVVAFYFGWSQLIFPNWGLQVPHAWLGIHLLGLACMMASAQTVTWSLFAFPWIRFVSLATVLIGLGAFGIGVPSDDFRLMSSTAAALTFVGLTAVAWIAAIQGVARDRCGKWVGWTGRLLEQVIDLVPGRGKGFVSAAAAQFWFESCRTVLFVALVSAVPVAAMGAFLPLAATAGNVVWAILLSLPLLNVAMASVVGQGLAGSDYWSRQPGISLFVATRPISTGSLLVTKLKVVFVVWLVALALILVLTPIAFGAFYLLPRESLALPTWSEFQRQNGPMLGWISDPWIIALILAVSWQSMLEGLSRGLIGRSGKIMWRNLVRLFVVGAVISAGIWIYRNPAWHEGTLSALPWAASSLVIYKVVNSAISFRWATTRGLLSNGQLFVLGVIWLGLAGVMIGAYEHIKGSQILPAPLLLSIAAWFLPGPAIPASILRLADNRHT